VTASTLLTVAALINLVLIIGLAVGMACFKAGRDRNARRREEELAQLRPVLMQYLASWEDGDARTLSDSLIKHRSTSATFEELVAGLLPKLRGADRSALVDILRRRGTIEKACRETKSRRSLKRGLAAELLGAAGAVEGEPYVTQLLHDRSAQVRLAAVRSLGRIGTPDAAAALVQHLDETGARIPPHPITMALLRIGPDATEPLLAALDAGKPGVQTIAAEVLGVLGLIPAAESLERCLAQDPEPGVRVAAARALGRLGMPSSVPGLIRSLQTERHVDVLATVAGALGTMGDPVSIPTLTRALGDAEPNVRVAAASALIQLGPNGTEVLRTTAQRNLPGADAAREILTHHAITTGADPERFMVSAVPTPMPPRGPAPEPDPRSQQ
jgi:HEAT repeat protein